MIALDIPGLEPIELEHLVLDLNGTIAFDGELIPGLADALARLAGQLRVVVVTADTHGKADSLRSGLGIDVHVIDPGAEGEQKRAFAEELGPASVIAIGNGANDAGLLAVAAIGICVLGPEGAATSALVASDVTAPDILTALGLLERPARLVATLRR
jgi:soluble P-type ATPase